MGEEAVLSREELDALLEEMPRVWSDRGRTRWPRDPDRHDDRPSDPDQLSVGCESVLTGAESLRIGLCGDHFADSGGDAQP